MSLPYDVLSSEGVPGTFLYPDNLSHTKLLDYELGGTAIGAGVDGLQVKVWTCYYEAGTVWVKPLEGPSPPTALFSAYVSELSFSFDRAMRPVVGYISGSLGYLFWYNTLTASYVTTFLGEMRSIRVTHDDKRQWTELTSDVLVAFLRNDSLFYVQQRDRYLIERVLATGIPGGATLTQVGMTDQLRVEFKVEVL